MDPDQLEPAAVHDHGGLTDTPSGDDSWARALLRRGWDLSRKAAIAGAAATAAPIVAPPLIVLSAAGVVLSIPFAAYLASLAGTNRLMGALLPSSPARPYPTTDQGDNDHVEEEFLDASEEYGQEAPAFGHWDTTEDDTIGSCSSPLLSRDHGVSEAPVLASGDDNNVVQEEGEGEFSLQDSGQDLLVSNSGDKKEERTTMEENKSAQYMPQKDFVVSDSSGPVFDDEENVVQSKEEVEVEVQRVVEVEQLNSNTDLVTGEVVDVQVEIVATAAPEGEVLPLSNLAACDSPVDLIMGEVFDMHVDIVADVEPQSEVLPPSNLAACDSPADLVTGEVFDMPVDIVATVDPESEVLHPINLTACDSPVDLVTGEVFDMHVDTVAAVELQSEVLPVNLEACESLAVGETTHDGDVVGITVMEDIVRDFGDINKEREDRRFFSLASMVSVHDGEKMSSGSTPYVSAIVDKMIHQPNQSTGEVLGRNVVAGCETCYTEEQLREQLDIIRTITGYGAVPSTTLEDELAGLYIFVGVESPVGSRDTSDRLVELNAKLQFLKSIIGVD